MGFKSNLAAVIIVGSALYAGNHFFGKNSKYHYDKYESVAISYDKVTAMGVDEYLKSKGESKEDYELFPVNGCPPKAQRDIAARTAFVAGFSRCRGIGGIRK